MGILRFSLLGFPVSVLPGYWLLTGLIGIGWAGQSMGTAVLVITCVFVSILAHELGHALAARAFGLPAQITFHMLGGATSFPTGVKLSRGRDILISLAGPGAGLLLGIVSLVLFQMYAPQNLLAPPSPEAVVPEVSLFVRALRWLTILNIAYSLLNLVPVIPFDGGRVLAAALGPRRQAAAATISLVVGLAAAFVMFKLQFPVAAFLFATAAIMSFTRMRQLQQQQSSGKSNTGAESLDSGALKQTLAAAEKALENERYEQASQLSHRVLSATGDRVAGRRALEVFLWSRLGAGDAAGARALLLATPTGSVDNYVAAAVQEAAGHLPEAQRLLTEARAKGDRRVEVTALLIKLLLEQKKFSAAANLTTELVGHSQPDDVRRVAQEASSGGALTEAARLSLQLAKAENCFADAAFAVRGFAEAGERSEALEAFKLALGFDKNKSRELLDDERLQPLRGDLEAAI